MSKNTGNDWINLGKIVDLKIRDGETKPRKSLQTGYNVEVIVRQTRADGTVTERVFPPKSYFNITDEKTYIENLYKNNPEKLEKALANLKTYGHVKYDVTASPAKDGLERSSSPGSAKKAKYTNDLDKLDLE